MNPQFAVGLFGVVASVLGLLAFAWAARRGQLRASEDVKFAVFADDDSEPVTPVSPRRARLFLAALVAVFAFITASFFVTLMTAVHAASPSAPAAAASSPLKCPF